MTLVSVIMPVRNAAPYLHESLHSISNQDISAFECIVIDDGSTDGSREIIQSHCANDNRFRLISTEPLGVVAAMNTGIKSCKGAFIARMDADDISHPTRLCKQHDYLVAHPEIGIVASRVAFGGDPEIGKGYARFVHWTNSLLMHEDLFLNRYIDLPFAHPSMMFRAELVNVHGDYKAGDFPEDYEWWLRWMEAGVKMHKLDEELLVWNDPPERLSRVNHAYSQESFYATKAHYLSRFLKRNAIAEARQIYIWGAGRLTRRRVDLLREKDIMVSGYIDIDPRKIGKKYHGAPVIGFEMLPPADEIFVVGYVASLGARKLIRAALIQKGFRDGVDFLIT